MAEQQLMVAKRNGDIVDFDIEKIRQAVTKAIKATGEPIPPELLDEIVNNVTSEIEQRFQDFYPNVENIQDIVEKHLVKKGLYEIAKAYILYRAKRQKEREEEKKETLEKARLGKLRVRKADGRIVLFDPQRLREYLVKHTQLYEKDISIDLISKEVVKNIYDGVKSEDLDKAIILSSISFIEKNPSYSYFSARLLREKIYKEVTGIRSYQDKDGSSYRNAFIENIKKGASDGLIDSRLMNFDLFKLSQALKIERDDLIQYMGLQTLYERYFLRINGNRAEMPQSYWMRIAMGLAINESNKNERAIEFYEALSSLRYVASTPTLLHAGLKHPQLSSCFLTTIMDDLHHIFKCIGDNAQLAKWSGGLGNDWTNIRATGSLISTTGVESQGLIPFLRIANDTNIAINRSGKRRGATCAYLETWHFDIEDFLDLRKNTGDERRRTHDMNTANWIPDLFMKRVINEEDWTLFSPEEVPELHHIYGKAFESKYIEYENKAKNGLIRKWKSIPAAKLWKKMLSTLYETGHPWMTFKDPCNIRSPQDHCGIIHSSNLCTEITLNTSPEETAVCNLGSINLKMHIIDGKLNIELLEKTIKSAVRMLDNVIDLNFYPTIEAKTSNMRHRPVGLGIMGFQDALFMMDIDFDSNEAIEFSDKSMEIISYYSILTSSELAKEKGKYESYKGSKWDRNIFPIDTISLLEEERGIKIEGSREETMDWTYVRNHVKQYGMRNSNVMAIAPTATIGTISGCFPCIEPIYKNIYVKANMSGEFTIVNPYLINDLKKLNLWNDDVLDQLKYYDGNLQMIGGIPDKIKKKYKEAFEIDSETIIRLAAARGKWIDQSQSLNIFIKGTSGKKLSDTYILAWKLGLKTTYYLRTLAVTQIEKSTLDANKYGYTQKREYKIIPTTEQGKSNGITVMHMPQNSQNQLVTHQHANIQSPFIQQKPVNEDFLQSSQQPPKVCLIDDPTCESCQ
jgi:ribonucleoside-diphosphate reductase alpha chain